MIQMASNETLVAGLVWLIASGRGAGLDFHPAGPCRSDDVIRAFLIDEIRETILSAGSIFTPCMLAPALLEAVTEAARNATFGDVVLLSPACSGFDQFRKYQHRGPVFCEPVKSIGWGDLAPSPHIRGFPAPRLTVKPSRTPENYQFASGFFLRKNPEAKQQNNQTSNQMI